MSSPILHILNGQCLYDYFKTHHLFNGDTYIPFNEAMCAGEVTALPFTDSFIASRPGVHQVTASDYETITLAALAPLLQPHLNDHFNEIHLYFDNDMFCQINLLTLLAYLDTRHFKGIVQFHLIHKDFANKDFINSSSLDIQIYPLTCTGYAKLYEQVLIQKQMPTTLLIPILQKGISLYLSTFDENWEVLNFIKSHQDLSEQSLVKLLLQTFKDYGLGDTQYIEVIKKARASMACGLS